MSTFNSVLINFRRNRTVTIIYAVIFIVISILTLRTIDQKVDLIFNKVKPEVILIDESEKSEFSDHFISYLSTIASVNQSYDDIAFARDLVESEDFAMLIVLTADSEQNLQTGKTVIDTYYQENNSYANIIKTQLNSYLRYLNATRRALGDYDYATVEQAVSQHAPVVLLKKTDTLNKKAIWFSHYISYLAYIIIAIFTTLLIIVLKSYNEPIIKARRSITMLSPFKQTMIIAAASGVSLYGLLLVFFALGLSMIKFDLPINQILLHLLNAVVFASTVISFALLITNFNFKIRFAHAIANVVSLGTAFLAGIFVPTELLPNAVVQFAKLLPAYYYVRLSKGIVFGDVNVTQLLAIQLLFTLCYFTISWYLSQQKRWRIG